MVNGEPCAPRGACTVLEGVSNAGLPHDLDVDVARLRLMKADHQSQQYRLEDRLLKHFPQEIERNQGMTIYGAGYTETKAAGEEILTQCKHVHDEKDKPIGTYRGFDMSLMYNPFTNQYMLTLKGAMSHQVELGTDPRGIITRIDNALAGIPKRIEGVQNRLTDLNQQMATARSELGKPFPQEDELRTKSALLAELDAKLNMDRPAPEKTKKQEAER